MFLIHYYYGFERRILVDARLGLVDDDDFIAIFEELKRIAILLRDFYYELNPKVQMLMELMGVMRPDVIDDEFLLERPSPDSLYVSVLLTDHMYEDKGLSPKIALTYVKSQSNFQNFYYIFKHCLDKAIEFFIRELYTFITIVYRMIIPVRLTLQGIQPLIRTDNWSYKHSMSVF
ncbi:MAG: hypothetical protein OXC92_06080 [Flavobacteriaceae bacterium]|nr:hypothetical protein [Flavobacteriaceae bacterium]